MEEKDLKVKISVKVADDGNDEYTPSAFCRLPWGWSCITSILLFILNVEYGKVIFGLQSRDKIGQVLLILVFLTFVFFIWKFMDKHDRGRGGSVSEKRYPYLGF